VASKRKALVGRRIHDLKQAMEEQDKIIGDTEQLLKAQEWVYNGYESEMRHLKKVRLGP